MLFGGDKKTDAIFKDNCFRSYKLSKPMILYRNFKGQKKKVVDEFGSSTIRPTQVPSDAVKRLLRAILTSRHLASNSPVTTSVRFEVIEKVPIDASGKRTNLKRDKKGFKKYIHVYEGHGIKTTRPSKKIKMKNGRVKDIKTLFDGVVLKHISKAPFTKNATAKNIVTLAHNRQNAKKVNNKQRRNNNTLKLNKNYANVRTNIKKNNKPGNVMNISNNGNGSNKNTGNAMNISNNGNGSNKNTGNAMNISNNGNGSNKNTGNAMNTSNNGNGSNNNNKNNNNKNNNNKNNNNKNNNNNNKNNNNSSNGK